MVVAVGPERPAHTPCDLRSIPVRVGIFFLIGGEIKNPCPYTNGSALAQDCSGEAALIPKPA